ncbi:unnamed protein product [Rotaria socialis]|uniref:EGF-like domain-containing protein n=1 Tax=Rotaria socialis TaxID=392032 RepID=A0A818CIM3_9BILA|nr:unnamed protein product [Rotaria socialis]CAF3428604.1 unnamed protein product [Rotaria socialis]
MQQIFKKNRIFNLISYVNDSKIRLDVFEDFIQKELFYLGGPISATPGSTNPASVSGPTNPSTAPGQTNLPTAGITCSNSPCRNNRPCYNNGNSYFCFCGSQYRGINCEEVING